MGITSAGQYVDFFVDLKMGEAVSLLSFVRNERVILKQKLTGSTPDKESIRRGIGILEVLAAEIGQSGQDAVIQKYREDEH